MRSMQMGGRSVTMSSDDRGKLLIAVENLCHDIPLPGEVRVEREPGVDLSLFSIAPIRVPHRVSGLARAARSLTLAVEADP